MAEKSDVPLICDAVPGPVGFLVTRRAMTAAEVDRLKRLWRAMEQFDDRRKPTHVVVDERQWPDAEFCAA